MEAQECGTREQNLKAKRPTSWARQKKPVPPSLPALLLCPHLIVLDGLGERLHVDGLIQLVLMQQLDEEVQRALVGAHLGVQAAHLLVHIHTALSKGTADREKHHEDQAR